MRESVRLHVFHRAGSTTLFFSRLPVRIGRDADNECRLGFPFVSRAHAVVERRDEHLAVRDVGSRFGTFTPSGLRLAPNQAVDLTRLGFEFRIGDLVFRVEVAGDEERR